MKPTGWVTIATAAGGVTGVENLKNWTIAETSQKPRFKFSSDGQSLLASVQKGLMILVR